MPHTLASYSAIWLIERRVRGRPLAPKTVSLYEHHLGKYLLPAFGTVPLEEVTRTQVRAWSRRLRGSDGPGQMVAAKCYRLLRVIFASAVEEEYVTSSPCTLKGAGDEFSPERPVLTVEQVLLLAGEVEERWRLLVLLAAFCSLRIGELAALRRTAVDLDAATLSIRATACQVSGQGWVVGLPKSAAGIRVVSVPAAILPDVRHHLARYAQAGAQGLVFVGPRGGVLRTGQFAQDTWRPAVARLGLTGVHVHDLRHTGNTLAASTGASLADLMARMGHASTEAAIRYQHATRAQDTAIAAALSVMVQRSQAV